MIEGEALVVYRFPSGEVGLAAIDDVRRWDSGWEEGRRGNWWRRLQYRLRASQEPRVEIPEVRVPPGTHLILTGIPRALRQRYGFEEQEGVVLVEAGAAMGTCGEWVRFNTGTQIRMEDLGEGQLIEVLSLAGTRAALYEAEFQMS